MHQRNTCIGDALRQRPDRFGDIGMLCRRVEEIGVEPECVELRLVGEEARDVFAPGGGGMDARDGPRRPRPRTGIDTARSQQRFPHGIGCGREELHGEEMARPVFARICGTHLGSMPATSRIQATSAWLRSAGARHSAARAACRAPA